MPSDNLYFPDRLEVRTLLPDWKFQWPLTLTLSNKIHEQWILFEYVKMKSFDSRIIFKNNSKTNWIDESDLKQSDCWTNRRILNSNFTHGRRLHRRLHLGQMVFAFDTLRLLIVKSGSPDGWNWNLPWRNVIEKTSPIDLNCWWDVIEKTLKK